MHETNRKRSKSFNKRSKSEKKKKIYYESEKENLAEIANNIEIVRLTDDFEMESEEDNDSDWESVSDIADKDIIVTIYDEEFDSSADKKNEKRDKQKQIREFQDLVHKISLLSLIGRLKFISRIIDDELLKNLAFSCVPHYWKRTQKTSNLHALVTDIVDQFFVEATSDESGDVKSILENAFATKYVSVAWINVLLVLILRTIGLSARLIAILYPVELRTPESKNRNDPGTAMVLVYPTVHKPSTRGKKSTKNQPKPGNSSQPNQEINQSCSRLSIVFSLELLDRELNRWIPFDGRNCASWNDLAMIVSGLPHFVYCLSIDENGSIRDSAPKYDSSWAENRSRRRRRIGATEIEIVLSQCSGCHGDLSQKEADLWDSKVVRERVLNQGVPKSLVDLKGHPIFVLESHLLKYEVLWPLDAEPVGTWRNQRVFLRDNVALVHTKETWLKEAKVVRPDEVPCKRVKTNSSKRKHSEKGGDPFVDLFGSWQVEDHVPPAAMNGIVPRNTFGNVDLFQPSMLPIGCTQLRYKDLDKVAIPLGIDCVPAMVGWAFTKRNKSRPIYDGWVVCNEDVDILKAAWREILRAKYKKIAEQRTKIVVKRWETLTRRLLLRERLRVEYNM